MLTAWGKTNDARVPSHHLAHHCMDVAAVLECLLRHPIYAQRAACAAGQKLDEAAIAWLAGFAFLHDIGKLSPGFQSKARPDIKCIAQSHLEEGAIWFAHLFDGRYKTRKATADLINPFLHAGQQACVAWTEALLAHHGKPVGFSNERARYDPRRVFPKTQNYDWELEEEQFCRALGIWFPAPTIAPTVLQRPELVHLFAGLLSLADWIGSGVNAFPHRLAFDPDYAADARKKAVHALANSGLLNLPWPATAPSFEALTGFPEPRGAQASMEKVPATAKLVILEAETGAGKTEAAILRFVRLRCLGLVDGLFFAVPTRAAAGQLQGRIHKAMERIGGPEAILAIPGQLRAEEAKGYRLPGFEVRWDDGNRHWAAEHGTRFLAAPVAVGTIDQALLGALQVKHAPARAAALTRSLLVIDEVHASDTYMNAIARQLVADHNALGGHALLMSATLGSAQRAAWIGTVPPEAAAAIAAPYPAIWHSNTPEEPLSCPSDHRAKTIQPIAVPAMEPESAAELAINAAQRGARVLVIRNTVDDAVATWKMICAARPDLCLSVAGRPALHHSRFAAEDRHTLDAAVEASFGKTSETGGIIAVGTQTLEQSLDICADLLITDLCPMDVLLQRIGRLHRHDRARPNGFSEAVVHVLMPKLGLDYLADGPKFENGLGAWKADGGYAGIYTDLRILELTRRRVVNDEFWHIPNDNRSLVEGTTHAAYLIRVEEEMNWRAYGMAIDAKGLAEGRAGELLALPRSKLFPSGFPDADENIQTRLGEQGPVFELPPDTIGAFGHLVTRLALPAHWAKDLTGDEVPEIFLSSFGWTVTLGQRSFCYTARGLMKASSLMPQ